MLKPAKNFCGKGRNRTHANNGLQPLALPAELPFHILQFRQELNLHPWVQSPMCLPLHHRTIEPVKGVEPLLQVWKTYVLVPLNTIPTFLIFIQTLSPIIIRYCFSLIFSSTISIPKNFFTTSMFVSVCIVGSFVTKHPPPASAIGIIN